MTIDAEAIGDRKVAAKVEFKGEHMFVHLRDGRTVRVPINTFRRLREATPEQRNRWQFIGRNTGIEWDELDEHLSVSSLLREFGAMQTQPPSVVSNALSATKVKPRSRAGSFAPIHREHGVYRSAKTGSYVQRNVSEGSAVSDKGGPKGSKRSEREKKPVE